MQKTKDTNISSSSKRPYFSGKEDISTDEELNKPTPRKPREKKIKERTSPATTDNDEQDHLDDKSHTKTRQTYTNTNSDCNQELDNIVKSTNNVSLMPNKKEKEENIDEGTENIIDETKQGGPSTSTRHDDSNDDDNRGYESGKPVDDDKFVKKEENDEQDNKNEENEAEKEARMLEEVRETYDRNCKMLNEEINFIKQYWEEVEGKEVGIKKRPKTNPFKYDYLGKEVERDEAEALEALSLYWLNNIARKANKLKNNKIREEDKPFYSKYCNITNGTKELKIEVAMRLMSLPHVVTVTLKSIPKIEVVVSDVALALQVSPELQSDDFEVTEAMGMHLF